MLSRIEAETFINDFYKKHHAFKDISFVVRDDVTELYKNPSEELKNNMHGAFYPKDNIVAVIAGKHNNTEELETTLKHELYGHYSLYRIEAEQKKDLLESVKSLQEDPKVKEIWDKVDKHYSDISIDKKAEEVYAFIVEKNDIGLKLTQEVDFKVSSLGDIKNISHHLQNQLHQGASEQKIFPRDNEAQFSKDLSKKDAYAEKVANQFIDAMEKGTAPWTKPWTADDLSKSVPYNASTGNRYQGVNMINLMDKSMETGDPRFLTYKQAQGMDANVKKGSKGIGIEYWQFSKEEIAKGKDGKRIYIDGKPKKIQVKLEKPRVYYATVFNGSQIEGLPELKVEKEPTKEFNANKEAENILKHSGASIRHQARDRAYYSPRTDEIVLPNKEQFKSEAAYYGTALHELSHWTGHESRLNRDMSGKFATPSYAKEELRAEIGSFMTAAKIGAPYEPNASQSYVKNWVSLLKDKPREIFHASSDANKISNYIIDLAKDKNIEKTSEYSHDQTIDKVNANNRPKTIQKSLFEKEDKSIETTKQEKNVYTIREAKIIEVPKENVKSWEKTFISKEATEKYMYKTGAAHNLPAKIQGKLHKHFEADMSTAPKKVKERMSTADQVKQFTQKQQGKSVEKSKDVEMER